MWRWMLLAVAAHEVWSWAAPAPRVVGGAMSGAQRQMRAPGDTVDLQDPSKEANYYDSDPTNPEDADSNKTTIEDDGKTTVAEETTLGKDANATVATRADEEETTVNGTTAGQQSGNQTTDSDEGDNTDQTDGDKKRPTKPGRYGMSTRCTLDYNPSAEGNKEKTKTEGGGEQATNTTLSERDVSQSEKTSTTTTTISRASYAAPKYIEFTDTLFIDDH